MPNWLPSLERPRAMRVMTGSAFVTAEPTRDFGVMCWAGPDAAEAPGVSGRPPKVVSGAGEPEDGEEFAGGP
jgi:hypothetical protein